MPQVSVGTTATSLATAPTDSQAGQSIRVKNKSGAAASVYLGRANTVTAAAGANATNGYELEAGETLNWNMQPGESLWGIVASGSVVVHVFEGGI
jgi:ABC-type taurine transport system substrate-binding protein